MAKALKVPAVRVKVTMRDIDPPVWRELVLPGHWHLGQVHQALQVAFEWYEEHLHSFEVGDRSYGVPSPSSSERIERETLVRVHEVLADPEHEEYQHVVEWLGQTYDPELVDVPGIDVACAGCADWSSPHDWAGNCRAFRAYRDRAT